jgi:hypothetical protein
VAVRYLAAALALTPLAALAEQPAPAAPPATDAAPAPPANMWVARPVAELRALDKITARETPLTVPVGQSATFGALTIAVRACVVRPPDQPADAAAFLAITDAQAGAAAFQGWMLLSAPAASMLVSPIYDIRLSACRN